MRANDSTQALTLRWGNRLAAARSQPSAVFDTADGWDLVWHLSSTTRDTLQRARIPDATAYGNDGVLGGYPEWMEGPNGSNLYFDGSYSVVAGAAPNVELGQRSFTMELWVNTGVIGAFIFNRAHSDASWNHRMKMIPLGRPNFPLAKIDWYPSFLGWGNPNVYATCSTKVDSARWVHLTVRRTMAAGSDSGLVQWYLNGVPTTSNASIGYLEADDPTDSIYLGKQAWDSPRKFRGGMAEFRISHVAQSDSWIRLSTLNQAVATPWIQVRRSP